MSPPIVLAPHAVLAKKAETVTKFDVKLKRLIRDMKATLNSTTNPKGVGLAAPQIGVATRLFITKPTTKSPIRVFINPEIIESSGMEEANDKNDSKLEGCLSVPSIWGKVKRNTTVTLQYVDETGTPHTETFHGLMAVIVQHETDHTNGILFTQRLVEQRGKAYIITKDHDGKDTLQELSIT